MSKSTEIDLGSDGKTVFVDDEVAAQVLQIIKDADKQITFVTPYIELWNHLKDEIHDAMMRKVQVIFFIREGTNPKDPSDLPWLEATSVRCMKFQTCILRSTLMRKPFWLVP